MFIYLIIIIFVLLYWLIEKRNNYWTYRKVINKKSNLIFGESFNFLLRKKTLNEIFHSIYKDYPDQRYVGIYEFFKPKLFIRDPELIGHILVKDFRHFNDRQGSFDTGGRLIYSVMHLTGEKWKNVRSKLMPIFSQHKLKLMYDLIVQCSEILINNHIKPAATSGEPVDLKDLTSKFTLDVIGTCAFGLQLDLLDQGSSEFLRIARMVFSATPTNVIRMLIQHINPNLVKYLGMKHMPDEMEDFFFDLLEKTRELRKNESYRRNDFVQLMLDIQEQEQNKGKHETLFTDDHLASNMMIFYAAGHETASLTLSFLLYELALNQEIQEKVRVEIKTILREDNGRIDFETYKKLPYLEMVISETLRKYSPAAAIIRLCTKTYQLPGTSLVLNPGDAVYCSVTGLHYDEKYYPNASIFDPERFRAENIAKRPPYTYLPFGDGPRICLGLRFAKLEIKCCLVSILSRYKFVTCDKTEIPLTFSTKSIFLNVDNGIWLSVQEL